MTVWMIDTFPPVTPGGLKGQKMDIDIGWGPRDRKDKRVNEAPSMEWMTS